MKVERDKAEAERIELHKRAEQEKWARRIAQEQEEKDQQQAKKEVMEALRVQIRAEMLKEPEEGGPQAKQKRQEAEEEAEKTRESEEREAEEGGREEQERAAKEYPLETPETENRKKKYRRPVTPGVLDRLANPQSYPPTVSNKKNTIPQPPLSPSLSLPHSDESLP